MEPPEPFSLVAGHLVERAGKLVHALEVFDVLVVLLVCNKDVGQYRDVGFAALTYSSSDRQHSKRQMRSTSAWWRRV